MANTNSSSAGSKPLRYYVEHREKNAESYSKAYSDGHSMYRAIARLTIGDPAKYTAIRNAVLLFAMRVRAQPSHILHAQYMGREVAFRQLTGGKELFAYLDSPDSVDANKELCWVIATALKIRVSIYKSISDDGQPTGVIGSIGMNNLQHVTLVARKPRPGDTSVAVQYSALLPDESGKALIEYLQATKRLIDNQSGLPISRQAFSGLKLRQVSWAWKGEYPNTKFTSFNEFRTDSNLSDLDLDDDLKRMDTFVAVVNDPRHIQSALELFQKALLHAPNQQRDVKTSSSVLPGRMLRHCAADAEFVKLPRESVEGKSRAQNNELIADGEVEELCSVLSFAVGIHFSLVINVLHMLEHANKYTVPALETLFSQTIFNKQIVKFWWNLQSDFSVMDNTIAHMYQGTARRPFWYTPYEQDKRLIKPSFRIGSPFLNGVRPARLEFPRGERDCEIHLSGTNDLNMSCPCRLGNIDIAALLNHFCRLHGFYGQAIFKRDWTSHRNRFNYGDLINCTLIPHRLLPLFFHLKDVAGRTEEAKNKFYQSLGGPGLEVDDKALGYVVMDVYALNVVVERFLTQDDPHLVALSLYRYSWYGEYIHGPTMNRPAKQRLSVLEAAGDVPLFEDNPKRFKREAFWKEYGSIRFVDDARIHVMEPSLVATAALAHWQHDERVNVGRAILRDAQRSPPSDDTPGWEVDVYEDPIESQRRLLLEQTKDPLAFWWPPETCAQILPEEYPDPIVRAGTTHIEALIQLLKSPLCRDTSPPPGFGADPGSKQGLQETLGRVPGSGLENAREIFEAYQKKTGSGNALGKLRRVAHTTRTKDDDDPDYEALVREKIDSIPECWGSNKWESAAVVRSQLLKQIQKEEELNNKYGKPSYPDSTDVFDPEGREYRRRVEATAAWNRPVMTGIPRTNEDGTWRSTATEMLKALDKLVPPESPKRAAAWEEVSSKRRRR